MPEDTPIHRRSRLNPMGFHAQTCGMCRRRMHPLPVQVDPLCPPCEEAMIETLATSGIAELERMLRRSAGEE